MSFTSWQERRLRKGMKKTRTSLLIPPFATRKRLIETKEGKVLLTNPLVLLRGPPNSNSFNLLQLLLHPPNRRCLLLRDQLLVRDALDSTDQVVGLDICEGDRITDIVAVGPVGLEVLLMVFDPGDDVIRDKRSLVGGAEGGVTDSKVLFKELRGHGLSTVCKSVDQNLIKHIPITQQTKLPRQIPFNHIRLDNFKFGKTVGRGFGEDGEESKGSCGFVGGPVLGKVVGEMGEDGGAGADGDEGARDAAHAVDAEVAVFEGAVALGCQGGEDGGLGGVKEGVRRHFLLD